MIVTRVFRRNQQSKARIIINRGGTRSSKSFSLMQLFVLELLKADPQGRPKILSVVGKTFPRLKKDVLRECITYMQTEGIYDSLIHNKTDNFFKAIVHTKEGKKVENTMEFFSIEQADKARGPGRTHLWMNEADQFTYEDFFQLSVRTSWGKVFVDFNPSDIDSWINRKLEQSGEPDIEVIVSTYKDNPFLTPSQINDILRVKNMDYELYKVFALGEYGKIEGVVFNNWSVVNDIPADATFISHGLDFGFTNDPTSLVSIYKQDGKLWVDELIYQRGLTNQDISQRLNGLNIQRHQEIIADSSEPKSIEEIYRYGFNVKGAVKGADSINASIDTLKGYQLMITSRSENLIKELRTYKWQKDKNGQAMNTPVDYNNHAIDALRYVALNKLTNKKTGKYHIY